MKPKSEHNHNNMPDNSWALGKYLLDEWMSDRGKSALSIDDRNLLGRTQARKCLVLPRAFWLLPCSSFCLDCSSQGTQVSN
jgi:hypothetical protein